MLAATITLAAGCGDDSNESGADEDGRTPEETIADFLAAADCEEHLGYWVSGRDEEVAECEADPDSFLPANPPAAADLELSKGSDGPLVDWRIDDQQSEQLGLLEGINRIQYTLQMHDGRWRVTGWAGFTDPDTADAAD